MRMLSVGDVAPDQTTEARRNGLLDLRVPLEPLDPRRFRRRPSRPDFESPLTPAVFPFDHAILEAAQRFEPIRQVESAQRGGVRRTRLRTRPTHGSAPEPGAAVRGIDLEERATRARRAGGPQRSPGGSDLRARCSRSAVIAWIALRSAVGSRRPVSVVAESPDVSGPTAGAMSYPCSKRLSRSEGAGRILRRPCDR
jgi:hypothetical protein